MRYKKRVPARAFFNVGTTYGRRNTTSGPRTIILHSQVTSDVAPRRLYLPDVLLIGARYPTETDWTIYSSLALGSRHGSIKRPNDLLSQDETVWVNMVAVQFISQDLDFCCPRPQSCNSILEDRLSHLALQARKSKRLARDLLSVLRLARLESQKGAASPLR